MHRTQISLDPGQYDFLLREARREGLSLSALLRRWVAERMPPPEVSGDALDRLAGIAEGDGDDSASEHDRHLYGRMIG